MNTTLSRKRFFYHHRILMIIMGILARAILKLIGWRVELGAVQQHPKCILIGAPHRTGWDFALFVLFIFAYNLPARWLGKHTIFVKGIRPILLWLGGIPVDRSTSHNLVGEVSDIVKNTDEICLVIAPEGTRKQVTGWKTGFYHIAKTADTPIVLGALDYKTKKATAFAVFKPSGDVEEDLKKIYQQYNEFLNYRII